MRTLSTEEAMGLLTEHVVDGSQGVGFCYHVLLAILAQAEEDEEVVVAPVDVLVGACERHQLSVKFVPEHQVFLLGVAPAPDPRGPMCSFGWSVEGES